MPGPGTRRGPLPHSRGSDWGKYAGGDLVHFFPRTFFRRRTACERLKTSVENPILVEALTKSYGSLQAVKGIDFEVRAGEVFGLLGPNGAGKTTTVEILEGLRSRSGGKVRVLGCDPEVQTKQLKDRVGVCLQSTRLQDKLQVGEAMELFGGFVHAHRGLATSC